MTYTLRPIRPEDDAAMAAVIRTMMTEFGCTGPGYSILDPEVDHLSATYRQPGAAYWVIAGPEGPVGGGGFGPLDGDVAGVCELRKMYFLPLLRGQGWGHRLMKVILEGAARAGYATIYLETVARMEAANALYRQYGFVPLTASMGHTGHHACDAWYALTLPPAGGLSVEG